MPFLEVLNELHLDQIEAHRRRYLRFMEYLLGEEIGGRMHLDKNPAYNLTMPLMLCILPGDAVYHRAAGSARCRSELLPAVSAAQQHERAVSRRSP